MKQDESFKDSIDWMTFAFQTKENTLYGDYDDKDYSQTDYEEEEKYYYENR